MARVFISYRHVDPDAKLARALYTRLSDADHEVFIDAVDIPLGALWDKQIARNVELADYFVPLVSATYLYSRYILDRELAPAAARLRGGNLAGFLQINIAYDGEPPAELKDVLSSVQFVKWRGDADTATVLDEVVRALPSARSLVKGMRSYEADDADRFAQMGRAREIDEATALLRSRPRQPVLLHGVSGAGKSSFIRAGLIPRLGPGAADVVELTEDTSGVLAAMPAVDVLFLDQFEQTLIRMAQGAEPSSSFAPALTAWLEATSSTVVFSIRDEYRTAFDTMLPAIAKRCASFPVVPFSPEVGADVLGQLLEDARVPFEPAFARQLCDELAEGVPRTTLPALLQLIVQYCRTRGEPLTAAAWDRLTERGAIFRDHVRRTVVEALPRRIMELRACEALAALAAGEVKAPAKTLNEVATDSGVDTVSVRATLEMAALPHARVVRTEKDGEGETRYRLIHDLFVPTIYALVRDARAWRARVRTLAVIATLTVFLAAAGAFWYRSYRQGLEMQRREARAIAGQIAAAATTPPNVESSGLRRGAALAVEALSRFDALGESSFTATTALRAGLSLLPRHLHSFPLKRAELIGFCRDGRHVLVRDEAAVWSWSPRGGEPATRIVDLTARARVALNRDRSSLAVASLSEAGPVTLRLVPLERTGEAWTLDIPAESASAEPTGLHFSADNSRVAIAAGKVILVDLAARRETQRLVGLQANDLMFAFFVGDNMLLGANEDSDHTLWDLRGRTPAATRVAQGPVLEAKELVLLPVGKAVSVSLVPREKIKSLLSVLKLDSADALDYHEAAQLLAVADYNAVSVYGLTGQLLATLQHTSNVNAIAFSDRGSQMVTASRDGTARIWDARTGRELARVADGPYDDARVTPDERTLITVGFEGLDSWEVPPQPFYRRVSDNTEGGPVALNRDGSLFVRGEQTRDGAALRDCVLPGRRCGSVAAAAQGAPELFRLQPGRALPRELRKLRNGASVGPADQARAVERQDVGSRHAGVLTRLAAVGRRELLRGDRLGHGDRQATADAQTEGSRQCRRIPRRRSRAGHGRRQQRDCDRSHSRWNGRPRDPAAHRRVRRRARRRRPAGDLSNQRRSSPRPLDVGYAGVFHRSGRHRVGRVFERWPPSRSRNRFHIVAGANLRCTDRATDADDADRSDGLSRAGHERSLRRGRSLPGGVERRHSVDARSAPRGRTSRRDRVDVAGAGPSGDGVRAADPEP